VRSASGSVADNSALAKPRELPASVRSFIGRSNELQTLTELLDHADENAAGAVVISAIGGTAGVGKTALAVHWAHQVADRFPDGQLYVNLRGYDPDQPMLAAEALARFLRALDGPGQDIPADEGERAARYRSLLAMRRMLVVLDNARDAEQIRPLLPGSPGCLVLVTSRDSLAGLVARDGAVRLDLDLLTPTDAVGLLRELIGLRVDADSGAAAALSEYCCRLPLALRVAAEIVVAQPSVLLAELAAELADQQQGLQRLDAGGDPRTAVRAVFSWSYRYLKPDAARAFRLVSLHPGPDLDLYAAAALTDTSLTRARSLLDQLARAHLIQATGAGRYGMHDLLSAYARQLTAEHDSEADRRAGLTRLFDYYLATAAAASKTSYTGSNHRGPSIQPPATPVPQLSDRAAAQEWLKTEQGSFVAIAAYATANGWPRYATQLSAILVGHYAGNSNPEVIIIHEYAHRAAMAMGDRQAEALAVFSLGQVAWSQGRYEQAGLRFRDALALYRETGDVYGEASALHGLGLVALQEGRYEDASDCFWRAAALCDEIGDRASQARALSNLGVIKRRQGHYREAADYLEQSLAASREIGDRSGEGTTLCRLGVVGVRLGRYQQARDYLQQGLAVSREIGSSADEATALCWLGVPVMYLGHHQLAASYQQRALAMFRESGERSGEAIALNWLAVVELRRGRHKQATRLQLQALAMFREIGERPGEASALNGLGEIFLATGQPGEARLKHVAALVMASQTGDRFEQARAHRGLGHACQSMGDVRQARRYWQEALAIYAAVGVPEADQLRTLLTETKSRTELRRADLAQEPGVDGGHDGAGR
jgi:tetratricopeptide (TPR) repeat protein